MTKHIVQIFLLIPVCLSLSCSVPEPKTNSFSSRQDTLLIATTKNKGWGVFRKILPYVHFEKITDTYSYEIKLPADLTNMKHGIWVVDRIAYKWNKHLEQENTELSEYLRKPIEENKLDTAQVPTSKQNRIDIISGVKNGIPVFVVDENNNQDLTDDSVRTYHPISWKTDENLINVNIQVYNGRQIVNDSTWVKVGTPGSKPILLIGSAEYVSGEFYLDGKLYEIGAASYQSEYAYHSLRLYY